MAFLMSHCFRIFNPDPALVVEWSSRDLFLGSPEEERTIPVNVGLCTSDREEVVLGHSYTIWVNSLDPHAVDARKQLASVV